MLAHFSHRVQYMNWNDLIYVLNRPWKSRLWTYQEILLASHPVITCGSEHVEWSDFEWTLLLLRSTSGKFPSTAITWESIALDRGKVSSIVRSTEPNLLHALQVHEEVVKRILAARTVLKITWVCLLLACLAVALLVSIIAVSFASGYPDGLRHFPLSWVFYPYEPLFLGLTAVMTPAVLIYAWSEVRDLSQPYRDGLNETATDDLVGALYQRAASNRRDMAYGIWAILHKLGASSLPEPTYDADDETEIPLLYRQPTVNLLEVTKNLRIL